MNFFPTFCPICKLHNFADDKTIPVTCKSLQQLIFILEEVSESDSARKMSKYGVFSGPYFPVYGLNTEIYGVKVQLK